MEFVSVYERSPDIEAIFEYNGVRKRNVYDGFNPVHMLPNGYLTSGLHRYLNAEVIQSDGVAIGTITFVTPDSYPNCLKIGSVIPIYDFPNIIGYATVTKILNPILNQ